MAAPTTSKLTFRANGDLVVNLHFYDWVVINSSAGKDSQATLDLLVELAMEQEYDLWAHFIVVHCDLGRMEWVGTKELAQEQADHYGLPFMVVSRIGSIRKANKNQPEAVLGDILDHVIQRHEANLAKGKDTNPWPDRVTRYCTSEHKTSQVARLIRSLESEGPGKVRVLNVLGLRADESADRAKKVPFGPDKENWSKPPKKDGTPGVASSLREVDRWLPIFTWLEEDVWLRIKLSGVRHHWAYDEGMPRLSCAFCLLASPKDWAIALPHNRALADAYIKVEDETGWAMREERKGGVTKVKISMRDIIAKADAA